MTFRGLLAMQGHSLLGFSEKIKNLEASRNPFAVVTACQLKAMASGKADDNCERVCTLWKHP